MTLRGKANPGALRAKWEANRSGRGRTGKGFDHYVEVANVYRRAEADGLHPTKAVGERFGVGKDAAVGWVRRCRESGLLPRTTKGKAKGQP